MSSFEKAIQTVLKHEGKESNHKDDPGGKTKYGISLRFLRQMGDLDDDSWAVADINHDGKINATDIDMLSVDDAINIYRLYFWEPGKFHQIECQDIATKLFDLTVNMGARQAGRIAQRAIRSTIGVKLKEDGIIGSKTFHAINMASPKELLAAIKSEAAGYYRGLVVANNKFEVFINGWLNRSYS